MLGSLQWYKSVGGRLEKRDDSASEAKEEFIHDLHLRRWRHFGAWVSLLYIAPLFLAPFVIQRPAPLVLTLNVYSGGSLRSQRRLSVGWYFLESGTRINRRGVSRRRPR